MHTCESCGKQEEGFKLCSRCKQVRYCSRECQVNSWPEHKKSCNKQTNDKEDRDNPKEEIKVTEEKNVNETLQKDPNSSVKKWEHSEKDDRITRELVKRFNSLPRTAKVPSGKCNNDWHFEAKFVPLNPPGHLLFILNFGSCYAQAGKIPREWKRGTDEESWRQGITPIIQSLLSKFIEHEHAPWKWSVAEEDKLMAKVMEEEFVRLGMRKELQKIGISTTKETEIVDVTWRDFFKHLLSVSSR